MIVDTEDEAREIVKGYACGYPDVSRVQFKAAMKFIRDYEKNTGKVFDISIKEYEDGKS